MELLRFTWRATLRRKLLRICWIAAFLMLQGWNIWQLLLLQNSGFQYYLYQNQELGLPGFLFFSFFAYEYMSQAEQVSLAETLGACYPRGQLVSLWQIVIMLGGIALLTLVQMGYHTAAFFLDGMDSAMLLSHTLLAVILNFTLILVLGALLGAVLSSLTSRITAYGILLGAVLLLSPLTTDFAMQVDHYFPGFYGILDYILILAPNVEYTPDQMYGLAMESCRWNIIAFWISLAALILTFRLWGKRSRAGLAVCLALLVFCGSQLWGAARKETDSVIRMDHREMGTMSGMLFYWEDRESRSEEAGFQVLSYDMELTVERNLQARVRAAVTKAGNGVYKFTLCHGYVLETLTDGGGDPLEYTRDGPYLEVSYDCPGSSGEIVFTYSGTGQKYYSNHQGIALPGYFPYYPMAGFVDLWDGNFLLVNTDFPEKAFTVRVNTSLPLITNLEPVGNNTFRGTASTVTILGGFLEVVAEDGYTYMRLLTDDTEVDFAAVEEATGVNLSDRIIMFVPDTLCRFNSRGEDLVVFEDHILINGYHPQQMIRELNWWLEGKQSVTVNDWSEYDAED